MGTFENKKIAVIGGGHIGLAFIEGLMTSGKVSGTQLIVANRTLDKILHLNKFGIKITADNRKAAKDADWIILAVKPSVICNVITEVKDLTEGKSIISFAAAVRSESIRKILKGSSVKIVRAMPNIPICTNEGVVGFYSKDIDKNEKCQLVRLFSLLGQVIETTKEQEIDRLTIISGCGPALVAHYINMLGNYGVQESMVMQIIKGTISYLTEKNVSTKQLINSVATKGGITESIIKSLGKSSFMSNYYNSLNRGLRKLKTFSVQNSW